MEHILGPKSHVSMAFLARLLLAMTMEIWHRECWPFGQIFTVFAILGQVGNTISPWGKGRSPKDLAILVPDDQGSIVLEFGICFSGLVGVVQLTVRATLLNSAVLAVFCPNE